MVLGRKVAAFVAASAFTLAAGPLTANAAWEDQLSGSTVWSVAYECQTDLFTVNAHDPALSHYRINMESFTDNQWSATATVREVTVIGPTTVNLIIPMTEVISSHGLQRSQWTAIYVVDTNNGSDVVTGTFVDTRGCPKSPDPTPSPGPSVHNQPSPLPSPTPTKPTPQRTKQPVAPRPSIKLPKAKYRVGKTIRMPKWTKSGAPAQWSTYASSKRVCRSRTKYLYTDKYRQLVFRSKIVTLRPGLCRFQVFSRGNPGEGTLAFKGTFRVVRRK